MTRAGAIKLAAGVVAVLGVSSYLYQTRYAAPRAELVASIESTRASNDRAEEGLAVRHTIRRRLKTLTASMLGGTGSVVEHELRSAVRLTVEAQGLGGVLINTTKPRVPANPYTKTRRGTNRSLSRMLRDQRDFAVIRGSLSGHGSLEQVLATIAAVDIQPWIQRIESLSIKPVNDQRRDFELRLGFASMYVPDLAPDSGVGLAIMPLDGGQEARWSAIASKHVFRYDPPPPAPPPPVVVVAQPDPPPSAPPPPAYHEWTVTGVVESARGAEVWLVNMRTNERRALTPGAGVLGATLVSASGESAVFEINGEQFTFQTGQTLANRRPVQ